MSGGFIPLVFFFFSSSFSFHAFLSPGHKPVVSVMVTRAHEPLEKSAPSHILQEYVPPIA